MQYNLFINNWKKNKQKLIKNHVYDELNEHSSCGVGLIASLKGVPKREIVEMGIEALKCLYHRGAVDADGKTGDGAGIQLDIPKQFFIEQIERTGHKSNNLAFGVGMIFLPRTNFNAQERSRSIVESEILKEGLKIYGWRHVPVNTKVIGEKAKVTRPEIEQVLIANDIYEDEKNFETKLYIIRKRIENQIRKENINDFYVCSFSCRSRAASRDSPPFRFKIRSLKRQRPVFSERKLLMNFTDLNPFFFFFAAFSAKLNCFFAMISPKIFRRIYLLS